jgi:hypothetical protein
MRVLVSFALLALLSGCSYFATVPAPGAPSPPPTIGPSTEGSWPARAFLQGDDIPPANAGAYGIVAFRSLPTSASKKRMGMFCESFTHYLPDNTRIPRNVPPSDVLVTVWPLVTAGAIEAEKETCDDLLKNYDLVAGTSAIRDAQRQGLKLSGRGPFMLAWSPPDVRGVRGKQVLVSDMSNLESQESFDQAMALWQDRIVSNASAWKNGFDWDMAILDVHDAADKYGKASLAGLKVFMGSKDSSEKPKN